MKSLKNVIFAVLALVLALCLSGCVAEPPAPTTLAPTPTTTAPTTEPPPDPAAIYADALAPILDAAEIAVLESKDFSVTVRGETFHTNESWTTCWQGLGTEAFNASATGNVEYDGETAKITEVFKDGTVYSNLSYYLGNFYFTSEMTAEDFRARYLPLGMLDSSLYGELTVEESSSGSTLYFRQATAFEAWLDLPAEAVLLSAEGIVSLDGSQRLKGAEYTVTYEIAGFSYSLRHTQEFYSTVSVVDVPATTQEYIPISHPDIPKWFVRIDGHLLNAENFSSHISTMTLSAAAGYYNTLSMDLHSWGSGATYCSKIDQSISATYASTNITETLDLVETYRNGKYTARTDGGAPQKNNLVTLEIMDNYVRGLFLDHSTYIYDVASAVLSDLGGSILIEFTMNDEFEQKNRKRMNDYLYDDEAYLDNLASNYTVDVLEGYLAFDKYSGLPTATGYHYSGTHTIYGQSYILRDQLDQSFTLASPEAYNAITEEFNDDDAPEVAPTPLFYKVTGQNGQTMWLLGTIHVGDNRTAHLPQAIWDAFDSADALAVECDTEAFEEKAEEDEKLQELLSDVYFYSDGTTTKDHIEDEELYTYALRMLKCSGNYNFNGLYFKPSVWSSTFDSFYLQQGYQLLSDKGVDHRLLLKAKDMGKPIYEVESSEFQIQMLNGWSEELMEFLLAENCSYDYPEYCASVLELYEAWLAGDETVLAEMLSDEEDTSEMTEEELKEYEKYKDLLEEYNNAMGPERNDDMLKKAIEYLESGETVFYAVGLAHLLAEDGLVYTLRDAGYTVELVSYE